MPARELRRHVHLGCTGVAMDVGQGLLGDAQDFRRTSGGTRSTAPEIRTHALRLVLSRKAVAELLERLADRPILGEVGRVKQVGEKTRSSASAFASKAPTSSNALSAAGSRITAQCAGARAQGRRRQCAGRSNSRNSRAIRWRSSSWSASSCSLAGRPHPPLPTRGAKELPAAALPAGQSQMLRCRSPKKRNAAGPANCHKTPVTGALTSDTGTATTVVQFVAPERR